MRAFGCYYASVFKTAQKRSLGTADLWSSIIGAIIAVVVHYFPAGRATMDALAWQIPIWVLAAVLVLRLVLAPFWIHEEQEEKLSGLKKRLTPQIAVPNGGVVQLPDTDSTSGHCKWAQITVECATEEPLVNCETMLKSLERVNPDSKNLVEEPVHCNWRQRSERVIQIHPGLPAKANLFSLLEGTSEIRLELDPKKMTLKAEIQKQGTYRGVVVVTAGGVPREERTFEFRSSGYDDLSLDLVG